VELDTRLNMINDAGIPLDDVKLTHKTDDYTSVHIMGVSARGGFLVYKYVERQKELYTSGDREWSINTGGRRWARVW